MNRAILFRGKRLGNGDWVYGNLLLPGRGETAGAAYIKEGLSGLRAAVDPETIGQYTGRQDSYGKRIFEGDILKVVRRFEGRTADIWQGVVEFSPYYGWRLRRQSGKSYMNRDAPGNFIPWPHKNHHEFTVKAVGNIHDMAEGRKMEGHIGLIGLIGPMGICPSCGGTHLEWDPKTDISICLDCGWSNLDRARENYERRIANGEMKGDPPSGFATGRDLYSSPHLNQITLDMDSYVAVGNIHDNPEWMEEEKQ